MLVVERLRRAFDVLTTDDAVLIGDMFETHVAGMFNQQDFNFVLWSTDINRKHNFFVESDTYPDFIISHKKSNDTFAVECKYRSSLYFDSNDAGKLIWSYPEQFERYKKFAKSRLIPVFIVVGLGGMPSCPKFLFCIPIREVKSFELSSEELKKFMRLHDKMFEWQNGTLK